MTRPSLLTEKEIRDYVDTRSFERAQEYVASGFIFDGSQSISKDHRRTLRAQSGGNSGGPYAVNVVLRGRDILASGCTCPIGTENIGHCKHVAALLLHWLEHPDDFVQVEDLDASLNRRSKAELIDLVQTLLSNAPDLAKWVTSETPRKEKRKQPAASDQIPDPGPSERQVTALLNGSRLWSHRDANGLDSELRRVVDLADVRLHRGDVFGATEIYIGMAHALAPRLHEFDENWTIASSRVQSCVSGLDDCLDAAPNPSTLRTAILDALVYVFRTDVLEVGGLSLSDGVAEILARQATPDERRDIAGLLRADIERINAQDKQTQGNFRSFYKQQALGEMVLKLLDGLLDDEAYLRVCAEAHLLNPAIARLLHLGRVAEAEHAAAGASDHELPALADVFMSSGHEHAARNLILGRAETSTDTRLMQWLREYFARGGATQDAIIWAQRVLARRPSPEDYQRLKALCIDTKTWPAEQALAFAAIKAAHRNDILVQIFLDEQLFSEAVGLVESLKPVHTYETIRVAMAVEPTMPEDAIRLYGQAVFAKIAERKRPAYAEAGDLLIRIRRLYPRLQQTEAWQTYFSQVKETARRLPALTEELAKRAIELG